MKKSFKKLVILLTIVLNVHHLSAQISGVVFRDYNNNGVFNNVTNVFPLEIGYFGATVNVYSANNTLVASYRTDVTGAFLVPTTGAVYNGVVGSNTGTVTNGTQYRVEFINPDGDTFNGDGSSTAAGSSNTDVQFVTASATTTNVNYGLSNNDWFVTTANPYMGTNAASPGAATSGTSATRANLFVVPYSLPQTAAATGVFDPTQVRTSPNSNFGSIFSVSYQRGTRKFLMSAYYKRHVGFGPGGIDAIYKTDISATGVISNESILVNVNTLAGVNVGTDTRSTTVGDPNYLNPGSNVPNSDRDAFANVGKRGIGGMDLTDNGDEMYFVSLLNNKLHRLNVGVPLKSTFTAADVTTWDIPVPAGGTTGTPDVTGGTTLNWHPFAVKSDGPYIFIGGVIVREKTTAHNLTNDTIGARVIVYQFDPRTSIFTEVFRSALSNRRGFSNSDLRFPDRNSWWCAWQNNGEGNDATDPLRAGFSGYNQGTAVAGAPVENFTGGIYYPQPIVSDIEFDGQGAMIISIKDRFGDQMGYQQPDINGFPSGTEFGAVGTAFRALTSGLLWRAGKVANQNRWENENDGIVVNNGETQGSAATSLPSNTPVISATARWTPSAIVAAGGSPWGGRFGPGWLPGASYIPPGGPDPGVLGQGGYYMKNQNFDFSTTGVNKGAGNDGLTNPITLNGDVNAAVTSHYSKNNGGLGRLFGTNEVVFTLMDPVTVAFTGGVMRMAINNNTNGTNTVLHGNMVQRLQLVSPSTSPDPSSHGKANGMGDLEVLNEYQPIQIGNRIWNDTNNNGIQDANETGLNGVILKLFAPGPDGAFNTADDIELASTTSTTIVGQVGSYFFTGINAGTDTRFSTTNYAGFTNTSILPGLNYQIRIENAVPVSSTSPGGYAQQAALAGVSLVPSNVAANAFDKVDSDGTLTGTSIGVVFNTFNTDHKFDFGFNGSAGLGDRVWLDEGAGGGTRNNGIQDGTEPGVAGVTVTLYTPGADGVIGGTDDVLIATTATDAFGNYFFDGLVPSLGASSSYYVKVSLPANHQFTVKTNTQGAATSNITNTTTASAGTAATGSDVNAVTGASGLFFLLSGEVERGVDAGLIFTPLPASVLNTIGDRVWLDNGGTTGTANDGLQNGNESNLAGVTVTLLDNSNVVIATTITDANGNYQFTDLPNGLYKVKVTLPAGMVFTTKDQGASGAGSGGAAESNADSDINPSGVNAGISDVIDLNSSGGSATGVTYNNIDAGLVLQPNATASLGDKVWNDINNNGTQDAGEPGIANVTVNLYLNADGNMTLSGAETTPFATAKTDAFGMYMFNGLPVTGSNKWQVEFVQPAGFNNTAVLDNNSGADATDSDIINNTTDRTTFIRLKENERNNRVDAGFVSTAPGTFKLGDKVWKDLNVDGQQSGTEPGVAGVTVTLCQNGVDGLPGTADDVKIATTSTDANGNYIFANLSASTSSSTNYNVKFSNLPKGTSFTKTDLGADGSDSDANNFGKTPSINLTTDTLNIDAGIIDGNPVGLGSIGNKVWFDQNGNGTQDAGDVGIPNAVVTLYKDANNNGIIDGAELSTPAGVDTTDGAGFYIFEKLTEGNYIVAFTTPKAPVTNSDYPATVQSPTGDSELDSDGNARNTAIAGLPAVATISYTNLIPLAPGQDRTDIDYGVVNVANRNTVGNKVWYDFDKDGLQDTDEPGVAGVTVYLYNDANTNGVIDGTESNTIIRRTVTDANGFYLFTDLPDQSVAVLFTNFPDGYGLTVNETNVATVDVAGSDANRYSTFTNAVTLNNAAGATSRDNRSLDAGIISITKAALGNKVWDDANGDGIQDVGEIGIPGVQVILYAANGTTVLASAITDQTGNYSFPNLPEGSYVVGLNPATFPSNMEVTAKDITTGPDGDGANTPTGGGDNDIDPVTNKTGIIALTAGSVNLTVDGGLRRKPTATVGNLVWDDINKDGIYNSATEPGVPGVLATLYNSANQPIGSAITDGDGKWLITNVPTGTGYYVIFTNKPAGDFTLIHQSGAAGETGTAGDSDTDSDANASGQTSVFNVTPNTLNVKIDAGITQISTLPVKYLSFTANKNGSHSDLSFTIAQAAPTSIFVIERSLDGSNFTAIGTLQGNATTVYNYTDIIPFMNAKNYYRIKEIEANSNISYSVIKLVEFTDKKLVEVYPNPTSDVLNINLNNSLLNKAVTVTIADANGRIVKTNRFYATTSIAQMNVTNLANGNYVVLIATATEIIGRQKIIIVD